MWLAQVTGSTSVNLLPVDDCDEECEKFDFTLYQGDVCKYNFLLVLTLFSVDLRNMIKTFCEFSP